MGVSLTGHRESVNMMCLVHQVQRAGEEYFLLHNTTYGWYLAFNKDPEHVQFTSDKARAVSGRYYKDADQCDVLWVATTKTCDNDLFLLNGRFGT